MKRLLIGALIVGTLVAGAALIGTASARSSASASPADTIHTAAAAPAAPPVYYKGKQINLAGGDGASLNCVIYLTHGVCFDTVAAMKANEARVARSDTPDGAAFPSATNADVSPLYPVCSTPLSVWVDEGYQGTEKDFAARGVWRNMTDYGINDKISSFIVGGCYSHLAENVDGGGLWYPCDTSSGAHHREMDLDDNNGGPPCPAQQTNWNDRVSSTWLN
ncbi:MAG TPA: hypothetical protein VGI69_09070 [Gaiellaceae bacterium]